MSKHVPGAGKLLLAAALRRLLVGAEAVITEAHPDDCTGDPGPWEWARISRKAIEDLASAVDAVKKGLKQEGL